MAMDAKGKQTQCTHSETNEQHFKPVGGHYKGDELLHLV